MTKERPKGPVLIGDALDDTMRHILANYLRGKSQHPEILEDGTPVIRISSVAAVAIAQLLAESEVEAR